MVGATYTIDPHVRTSERVLESLFRTPGEHSISEHPTRPTLVEKIFRPAWSEMKTAKTIRCSLPAKIFGWLAQEQQQHNLSGDKPCVLILDGAEAMWAMGATFLAGAPNVVVLDLIHACSYVWKAVHALHPYKVVKNQVPIVKGSVGIILCGEVYGAIRGLRWEATHNCLSGECLKKLERICSCFEKVQRVCAMTTILKAGYQIASGVIEGAFLDVVVDRIDATDVMGVRNQC